MSSPYREPSPPLPEPRPAPAKKRRTGWITLVVAVMFAVLIAVLSITSYDKNARDNVPSGGDIMRSDHW